MAPEYHQFASDLEALDRLVPLAGRRVVHVGCGNGALCFELAKRGATVLGVDSDPEKARASRALGAFPQISLVEGFAQNLPENDGTVDCVVMLDFLSHRESEDMDACLAEACRVLKAEGGALYVADDATSGSYDDMLRLLDDRSTERAWALEALGDMPEDVFASAREINYNLKRQFADFETFLGGIMAADKTGIDLAEVDMDYLRALFEQGRVKAMFEFDQARRVDLYTTGGVAPS
jgi:ubiquinone/menaquinone biosynthesis C-methylase UbiE